MGTTQRIVPGVTGEPNWPKVSLGVTTIAKTVQKEQQTQDPKQQQKLEHRRERHSYNLVYNLLRAGGGRSTVSRGGSSTVGRAGLRSSRRLAGFLTNVGSAGLGEALRRIGLTDLTGKSVQDIVDYLLVYCSDTSTGMDETAATAACNHLLNQIGLEAETLEVYEAQLQELVQGNGLVELLSLYFGYYLFEHLSQRFDEKISQMLGEAVCEQTFDDIKTDIIGRIKLLSLDIPLQNIDWSGEQGREITERIFNDILLIYEP